MRRRAVIAGLATVAAWPLAAAQRGKTIPRVGFLLGSRTSTANQRILGGLRQGLSELGYVEGQNILLELRWHEGRAERMRELITELVSLDLDVLVVGNSFATRLAKNATARIPIVMLSADPVGLGLVDSLARPGGNVTGLSFFTTEVSSKRVELLKELVPGLSRIAVLTNPTLAAHPVFWQSTEMAAKRFSVTLQAVEVRGPEDFEAAFTAASTGNAQALIAFDDPLTVAYTRRIVTLAASSGLPAIYGFREFSDDGGLMSYGPSFAALYRSAAAFVDKILKGAKPKDLPIEQATKFELVLNLRAAKALGIEIPLSIITRADEVIE